MQNKWNYFDFFAAEKGTDSVTVTLWADYGKKKSKKKQVKEL